jgi:hypothetical protein
MMRQDLFVAGVPATGKSWLGRWLAKEHGYLHIDAERDGGADFDREGVHREWDQLISTGCAETFVQAISRLPKPVILNWGFPTRYLYIVSALQAYGVRAWWFHAQRHLAQQAFVARGGIDPVYFDRQMNDIDREWLLIASVFGSHVVEGLHLDGSQRTPEELWREIAGRDDV